MMQANQRTNHRFKVAFPAVAFDSRRRFQVPCMIRDGSISGCKIISSYLDELPNEIYLKIPDLIDTIQGRIVWRDGKTAGVQFNWEAMPSNCKRAAPRREVQIPAVILDLNRNHITGCTIRDASLSGCRISCANAAALPREFRIKIKGLTEPVIVRLVWRKGNQAGLEFFWDSEVYTLVDSFAS